MPWGRRHTARGKLAGHLSLSPGPVPDVRNSRRRSGGNGGCVDGGNALDRLLALSNWTLPSRGQSSLMTTQQRLAVARRGKIGTRGSGTPAVGASTDRIRDFADQGTDGLQGIVQVTGRLTGGGLGDQAE